jgi:hypothetical protein
VFLTTYFGGGVGVVGARWRLSAVVVGGIVLALLGGVLVVLLTTLLVFLG